MRKPQGMQSSSADFARWPRAWQRPRPCSGRILGAFRCAKCRACPRIADFTLRDFKSEGLRAYPVGCQKSLEFRLQAVSEPPERGTPNRTSPFNPLGSATNRIRTEGFREDETAEG